MHTRRINSGVLFALFVFTFMFSILVNMLNIDTIKSDKERYTYTLIHDSSIWSPDNSFYTTQVKNYLNGDGFTLNPEDPIMSVRRAPGYPLFYGVHYGVLGEELAHKVIPYTQSIIFSLSVVAFSIAVTLITNSVIMGYSLSLLYGTSIFFVGYLFHTITEGVHPELAVFSLYYISKFLYSKKVHYRYIVLSGIFCAMTTLTRPIDGVLLISLILTLIAFNKFGLFARYKSILILIIVFVVMFAPWVVHNYYKIGEFVFLEKYYQSSSLGAYGAKHESLGRWMRAWGHSPPAHGLKLHQDIRSDIGKKNRLSAIESFIDNNVPKYAYIGYSKDDLHQALVLYQKCIDMQIETYTDKINRQRLFSSKGVGRKSKVIDSVRGTEIVDPMQIKWGEKPLECEANVVSIFDNFSNKIKEGDPLRYYIIAPVLVRGSQYILHSFTGSFSSLNPIDKKFNNTQYFVKSFFYISNVLLWIFSIIYLFLNRNWFEKFLLGSNFAISIVLLIFIVHVEPRYMLAVYPSMYIMSAITVLFFVKKITLSLGLIKKNR